MNKVVRTHSYPDGLQLEIVHGDLTQEQVDAIVNAANEMLAHGGGIAAAIVRRGGTVIQEESRRWVREHGPVSHAEPAYTTAGSLPARYVIHAVGPVWGSGDEDKKLAAAIRGSLNLADRLELRSIALPAISTGIFGYPVHLAAGVFLSTIDDYAQRRQPAQTLRQIRLILYDQPTLDAFLAAYDDHFRP